MVSVMRLWPVGRGSAGEVDTGATAFQGKKEHDGGPSSFGLQRRCRGVYENPVARKGFEVQSGPIGRWMHMERRKEVAQKELCLKLA